MTSGSDEFAVDFGGGVVRSAWVPFLRLVFVFGALSCLGMAFDGTSAEPLQVVLLAASLAFFVLVVRSFFVRITVPPSGSVRRVGWRRTEGLGRLSARPLVIRSSFYRYAWPQLIRRQDGAEEILMDLAAVASRRAVPRVMSAFRTLNGLPFESWMSRQLRMASDFSGSK